METEVSRGLQRQVCSFVKCDVLGMPDIRRCGYAGTCGGKH